MRALSHEIIKTEMDVSEHVKHERQCWRECGLRHQERTDVLHLKRYI